MKAMRNSFRYFLLTGKIKPVIIKEKKRFRELLIRYYIPVVFGQFGDGGEVVEIEEIKFKKKKNGDQNIDALWSLVKYKLK